MGAIRQERENGKLVLLRRVWEETETTEYLESVRINLAALRDLVRRNLVEIVGAVVETGTPEELLQQITHWIDQHMDSVKLLRCQTYRIGRILENANDSGICLNHASGSMLPTLDVGKAPGSSVWKSTLF